MKFPTSTDNTLRHTLILLLGIRKNKFIKITKDTTASILGSTTEPAQRSVLDIHDNL